LELPGVSSLKEKRHRLKSMITRIRNDFNVSIAEIDQNDVLRRATLGAAVVANQTGFADQVIAKVMDRIRSNPEIVVLDYQTESW
jgi:uncharacterized protein YlxP (DUF503 family)